MALDALTISFSAKLKAATPFPSVVSYAVDREYTEFALELPGSESSHSGFWIHVRGNRFGLKHNPFPINKWMQVSATWNGKTGEYAIYVNGKPVVGPAQDDKCKDSIRSGGKFILGQKQKEVGFTSDHQFIGSVVHLQMWSFVLNAWQLGVLWGGDLSHPDVDVNPLLDDPPTYTTKLVEGARCDEECRQGQYETEHDGVEIRCRPVPRSGRPR
jgi:hypothetical protein